jgi:hypothetical protein
MYIVLRSVKVVPTSTLVEVSRHLTPRKPFDLDAYITDTGVSGLFKQKFTRDRVLQLPTSVIHGVKKAYYKKKFN